ncbi:MULTISPECIES: hypothetical protein [Bacillaceae]|uniref:Uncharacterized protein n=1 Tax=Bacillus infantis NRRL B-14911 TaxID=1367477 RepID=U5LCS7_9BACI|nr:MULTISPECIES: hypothetical protein [Bacillus]OXT16236.1 hypothetical protein B9K06_16505 [Bacillus sp. OG2]AGX04412.1 hypothetical protein N288_12535 [Bacillus infantis NRRL B-14911]MCA1034843.1 hypothetical protein [Bacillus infantis]MCP1158525.1 hypothetical protein [Bacillus infantis]MDT0158883.1 hypothetical protein [Bacillus sp. AG4(2022)]
MAHRCSHPYRIYSRKVEWNVQKVIETEYHLHLYDDRVVAEDREFRLADIYDVSYREQSSFGFLYLHTNHGLYPYKVYISPEDFIRQYRIAAGKAY